MLFDILNLEICTSTENVCTGDSKSLSTGVCKNRQCERPVEIWLSIDVTLQTVSGNSFTLAVRITQPLVVTYLYWRRA